MKTFQKNVSFTDADGQTVFIEISLTDGKLSMVGHIAGGGGGQCQDRIKPANDAQKSLLDIWNAYHLNDMHAGTPEQENALNSEEFETFRARFESEGRAKQDEARKIERIANMDRAQYGDVVNAFKDGRKLIARAAVDDLQEIKRIFKVPHANGHHFEKLQGRLQMGRTPFADVDFKILGTTPIKDLLSADFSHYSAACVYLKEKNLLIASNNGQPYKYGSAWLTRELPADICERLENLCAQIGGAFEGSPYEKQANDFLKRHNITFEAESAGHGKHFPDDNEARARFWCTFEDENGNSFRVKFGQSIAAGDTPPTVYDVLACLTKSDPGTLENFCSEYGYDLDSKKAERIYNAVRAEWDDVFNFFTDEQLTELQNIG